MENLVADRDGDRVDSYVAEKSAGLSRSYVQKLIAAGDIAVNGKYVRPNYRVKRGDNISISIPAPEPTDVLPEEIPLDILYEDDDVIVVNKPQGMVVHPASGNHHGTLVNALLMHCKELSGINGVMRPGIVHRIDKDTSGVIVAAKNDMAHKALSEQIRKHTTTRRYIALVEGVIKPDSGTIEGAIGRNRNDRKKMDIVPGGKSAVTHFKVLERFKNNTLIEARLETGRTHQIRVHLSHIGHPVVGDPVYGIRKQRYNLKGQALHAAVLGFVHPRTGQYMEFSAPLPDYFRELLNTLRENDA